MTSIIIRRLRVPLSQEENGATAVEYALLVALIAAVIIGIVFILGGVLVDAYNSATVGW